MSPAKVFLVGMMGVGKSTTGRLLAEALGWPLVDTDEEIARDAGKPLAQIFEDEGEDAFRAREAEAVCRAAALPGPAVVALGGGAVLMPESRSLIKTAGLVVWLRANPSTLADRVGDGSGRPLLRGGPAGALKRLSENRAPVYDDVSDLAFDVDLENPRDVANKIALAVRTESCAS